MPTTTRTVRQQIGLVLGPALALLIVFLGPPEALLTADGVEAPVAAWHTLALLALMAVWWVSEAIPIPVTSLLPLVIIPVAGILPFREASAPYMSPIVVLLLGGFIVAKAIERWHLHARIALNIVLLGGSKPAALLGGFMAAAAILSMWISNTATSIMMMPIAVSVAREVLGEEEALEHPFTYALLLGIAWSCSIGGLGTPVGTPTNLIVIDYLNDTAGVTIGFPQWMIIGIPVVAVMVPAAWFVLTRWAFRLGETAGAIGAGGTGGSGGSGRDVVRAHLDGLGPVTSPEIRTLGLFLIIAGLWILRVPLGDLRVFDGVPFAGLTDAGIAIFGVVLAFLIPAGGQGRKGEALLDWPTAETIPWGVILLFGGGLSLATAIRATGLGVWIGAEMAGLAALPILIVMAILTTFVIFFTEITSNVATAAALTPVVGGVAIATGLDVALLTAPLAMAASCAFMLPLATGPNAVAYATGRVSVPVMAKAGFRLNLVGIVVITLAAYVFAPIMLRQAA